MRGLPPVAPEKIELIHSLLSDPTVRELWLRFIAIPMPEYPSSNLIGKRNSAFRDYTIARDLFLGLPSLNPARPPFTLPEVTE